MQKVYNELTNAFRKNGGVLSAERYEEIATRYTTLFEQADTILLLLQASGYPISEAEDGYRLKTCFTPIGSNATA